MDHSTIMIALAGLFIAGIIKGATGLGYASCALPFLVTTVGLKPAMVIILLSTIATNASVAFTTAHLRETVTRFATLYLAMIPGIAIGIVGLQWLDQRFAASVLGGIMVIYGAFAIMRPSLAWADGARLDRQFLTGMTNGIVTGLTGSQVMPLIPYVMSLQLDPARTVQAVNTAVMIATLALAAGLAASGLLTKALLAMSLVAVLPALGGVEIGIRLRKAMPAEGFRTIVLVVLMVMGIGLIARG